MRRVSAAGTAIIANMATMSMELRRGDREGPGMGSAFCATRIVEVCCTRNEDVFFPEEKNTQLCFGKTSACDGISWAGRGGSRGIG